MQSIPVVRVPAVSAAVSRDEPDPHVQHTDAGRYSGPCGSECEPLYYIYYYVLLRG